MNERLNPFEFRAGIYFSGCTSQQENHAVLIPLNSGLVFTCSSLTWASTFRRLNPFEFRAGIYFIPRCATVRTEAPPLAGLRLIRRLNPFEFRAGIYLLAKARIAELES